MFLSDCRFFSLNMDLLGGKTKQKKKQKPRYDWVCPLCREMKARKEAQEERDQIQKEREQAIANTAGRKTVRGHLAVLTIF